MLQDLDLNISKLPDLAQIRSEVQLMQQETGRSLSIRIKESTCSGMPPYFIFAVRGES